MVPSANCTLSKFIDKSSGVGLALWYVPSDGISFVVLHLSLSPYFHGHDDGELLGIQCFEGMKAYKPLLPEDPNAVPPLLNEIRLFRPLKNMERLASSMQRLSMPGFDFDPQELIQCIATLVRLEEAYIPTATTPGYALYIRPTVIATHPFLGLCPPEHLLLYVLCSPVGPYYKSSGFAPVRLLASSEAQIRAWPGGTGGYKIGGNYAPTMWAQQQAVQQGCGQVLWLLQDEITEVGAMNVFFVLQPADGASRLELVTPPLSRGDILPGVTRDSVLTLARTRWSGDVTVAERNITMTEVVEAIRTQRLREAFGTGTAAVVTPIASIQYQGTEYSIPTGIEQSLTQRVWDAITGIQYGSIAGPEGWSVLVP
jgi:branched-chain amino acid aminotransferase